MVLEDAFGEAEGIFQGIAGAKEGAQHRESLPKFQEELPLPLLSERSSEIEGVEKCQGDTEKEEEETLIKAIGQESGEEKSAEELPEIVRKTELIAPVVVPGVFSDP